MSKRIRMVSVFFALMAVLFMIVSMFVPIQAGEWETVIELVAAFLIAVGVLTNTGEMAEPLTWKSFMEKLKSPLAVNSIFALAVYFIYRYAQPPSVDIIVKALSTMLFVIFGVAVENNPNARDTFK